MDVFETSGMQGHKNMISTSAAPHLKIVGSQSKNASSGKTVGGSPTRASGNADADRAEFRQRMKINCFAAAVLIALLSFGIWLADEMVATEKAQGCYASGYHS